MRRTKTPMRFPDGGNMRRHNGYAGKHEEKPHNIFSPSRRNSRFHSKNRTISPNVNRRLNFDSEWLKPRDHGYGRGEADESPKKFLGRDQQDLDESFYTDSSDGELSEYSDEDYSVYEDQSENETSYDDETSRRSGTRFFDNISRCSKNLSVFSRKVNRSYQESSKFTNSLQKRYSYQQGSDFTYFNQRNQSVAQETTSRETTGRHFNYTYDSNTGRYLNVTPPRAVASQIQNKPRLQSRNKPSDLSMYQSRNKNRYRSHTPDVGLSTRRNTSPDPRPRFDPAEAKRMEMLKGSYLYGMDISESKRVQNLRKSRTKFAKFSACYYKRISEGKYRSVNDPSFFQYMRNCKIEYTKAKHLEAMARKIPASGEAVYLQNSYSRTKTLLLDMDETLIHSEEFKQGVSYNLVVKIPGCPPGANNKIGVFVRPFCKEFLSILKKNFELVIFTAARQDYADQVLNALDPHNEFFSARLYRQNCSKVGGTYVKDFRVIKNRNPRDMILVDNLVYSFAADMPNGIPIKPFMRGGEDCELEYLAGKLKDLKSFMDVEVFLDTHFGFRDFYKSL